MEKEGRGRRERKGEGRNGKSNMERMWEGGKVKKKEKQREGGRRGGPPQETVSRPLSPNTPF